MSEEQRKLQQEHNDILHVMSTENGRRFMWRILSYCRIYHDVEGTTEDVIKQLGRRQAGLFLLSIISEADDELVFKMMREAKNRDMEEAHEYRKQREDNRDRNEDNIDGSEYFIGGDNTNYERDEYSYRQHYSDLI